VVFKDREVFNEDLVFYVNYLGGEAPTATLNFSKGSATVLMQYYMFLRFGRNGTRIMRYALDHAMYLRDRLIRGGEFQIMNQAQRIPVVALTLDGSIKGYNEFDIANKVREKGWILSAYSMPPDAQEINSLRIVIRPHMNRGVSEIPRTTLKRLASILRSTGEQRHHRSFRMRAKRQRSVEGSLKTARPAERKDPCILGGLFRSAILDQRVLEHCDQECVAGKGSNF
jgi:glutamate decarboxylase